jgi:hypothetical protein
MNWQKLLIGTFLFALGVLLFSRIKRVGYFTPTPAVSHIIDVHLQPDGTDTSLAEYLHRFFDAGYVREAAKRYVPSKYLRSFFMVDLFFPIAYGFFFLSLAAYWQKAGFCRVLKIAVGFCVAFDLLENSSFAFFLFHQQTNAAPVVALFTTLKSILFVTLFATSILAFVIAVFKTLKNRRAW